jgi:hypothetical protein
MRTSRWVIARNYVPFLEQSQTYKEPPSPFNKIDSKIQRRCEFASDNNDALTTQAARHLERPDNGSRFPWFVCGSEFPWNPRGDTRRWTEKQPVNLSVPPL